MLFQFSQQIVSKALLSTFSERDEVMAEVICESQATACTDVFVEIRAVNPVDVIRIQARAALEHGRLILF